MGHQIEREDEYDGFFGHIRTWLSVLGSIALFSAGLLDFECGNKTQMV